MMTNTRFSVFFLNSVFTYWFYSNHGNKKKFFRHCRLGKALNHLLLQTFRIKFFMFLIGRERIGECKNPIYIIVENRLYTLYVDRSSIRNKRFTDKNLCNLYALIINLFQFLFFRGWLTGIYAQIRSLVIYHANKKVCQTSL